MTFNQKSIFQYLLVSLNVLLGLLLNEFIQYPPSSHTNICKHISHYLFFFCLANSTEIGRQNSVSEAEPSLRPKTYLWTGM